MPIVQVTGYRLAWCPRTHQGTFAILAEGQWSATMPLASELQVSALAVLVRTSGPLGWETDLGVLLAGDQGVSVSEMLPKVAGKARGRSASVRKRPPTKRDRPRK
jgi:hypothetical protein